MNLRLYIKQHVPRNLQGKKFYYKGTNPSNLQLQLIDNNHPFPSDRTFPGFPKSVDVTDSVSDLHKLRLTWTTDKDDNGFATAGVSHLKKSSSGNLTFEGEAYKLLKQWLIDDPSAPLNKVEVEIDHEGCGTYYDYIIKASDLRWCENEICTFDVTLKQEEEKINCIKNTLIADNHKGWFDGSIVESGAGNKKKHPRFSYCNEIRPNGLLVFIWWISAVFMSVTLTFLIPVVLIFNAVMFVIIGVIKLINKIINAVNSLLPGTPLNPIDEKKWEEKLIDKKDIEDQFGHYFVESGGCGREHPAPLIRDYIWNVCEKCNVKVNSKTAPIFFAETMTVETSDPNREGSINGVMKDVKNPHYNACYFYAPVERGIRRWSTLNLFAGAKINKKNYYIADNSPIRTLEEFLNELKPLYNAEWRVRTINNEQWLYFQRKDYYLKSDENGPVYDFSPGGKDRQKILEGVCFEWNEQKNPASAEGLYVDDGIDTCGNEAKKHMFSYESYGNTDINPTFEGRQDKTTNFGATKFRLDGASTDYLYDAMQVVVNSAIFAPLIVPIMRGSIAPYIRDYADYALLLKDETASNPKVLLWDPESGYENARCINNGNRRTYYTHFFNGLTPPPINNKYNSFPQGLWPFKHPPETQVKGRNMTAGSRPPGYYSVLTYQGKDVSVQPALLVNYPMYFEPGYYDTMWDWFHWIDDPRRHPKINQNWTVKIELCCDDLKILGVLEKDRDTMLGEKVRLPIKYYDEGKLTEIEVSYDTGEETGQYIQLKGTV